TGFLNDDSEHRSNIEANAGFLSNWLLVKLENSNPSDIRVQCAIEVLANTKLPLNWKGPSTIDTTYASILDQNRDTQLRSNLLACIGKLDPSNVPHTSPLRESIRKLCVQPDPRLYRALVAQTARLQIDVTIPKIEVATREGVLARLGNGDANRGRRLFFDVTDGTGCAACHRVSGKGNDFAPDLSGIGLRAKPETIVESILTPSAAITEGYSQQLIVTQEGLTITGVVLRETSTELTVFKTDRTQQTVPVASIVERQKMKVSAMPDGYGLYGNDQVADLAAYLMTLKFNAPSVITTSRSRVGD
ncbi:MAG: c-type cytochrome, partial [Planctomycetes bacterium]|nr:c-type cytochrome [Planctomycetota bacterium]